MSSSRTVEYYFFQHHSLVFVRKRNKQTELVLLDHGLYQDIPESERIYLSFMWKAIVLNNQEEMKKYAGKLGVTGIFALKL